MYYIGENRKESNLKLYDKVAQNIDQLPKGTTIPGIRFPVIVLFRLPIGLYWILRLQLGHMPFLLYFWIFYMDISFTPRTVTSICLFLFGRMIKNIVFCDPYLFHPFIPVFWCFFYTVHHLVPFPRNLPIFLYSCSSAPALHLNTIIYFIFLTVFFYCFPIISRLLSRTMHDVSLPHLGIRFIQHFICPAL